MARPGGVWWNAGKNAWYATIGGSKVRLASKADGRAKAVALWHDLKAKDRAPERQQDNTMRAIFALYLDHIRDNHATTYPTHKRSLQSFLDVHPNLKVSDLRAVHIEQWLVAHPTWAEGTQRTVIAVVLSALSWACKPEQRYIPSNPLRGYTMPPSHSRGADVIVTPEDHAALMAVANPATKLLLTALRCTGMRPSTVGKITAATCKFDLERLEIAEHKTRRRTGKPLLIPLSTEMKTLCVSLAAQYPTGPLFRTATGKPWTARHIKCVMVRLRRAAGLSESIVGYGYRHGLATELLQAGVAPAKVAAILGHTNTDMLFRHYSHLPLFTKPLADELTRILNESESRRQENAGRESGGVRPKPSGDSGTPQ